MKSNLQKTGSILGPLLFILVLFLDLSPSKPMVTRMASVAILMAAWWVTETIPIAGTALLPMILFPLLGILKGETTAAIYFNSTIFLFLGGFMIGLAMEKWRLHKRIALMIISIVGGGPSRIILGFMIAAGFLSMWISNTATAIMMLPVGLAIISQMEERFGEDTSRPFNAALLLGIAYSCSIGGMATLVGTPPNMVLQRVFELTFPHAPSITFGQWIVMALPLSILLGFIVWLLLTNVFFRFPKNLTLDANIVKREYRELGKISYEEKIVGLVFLMTALLWIFREPINVGIIKIPGWSELLPYPDMIDDGTVAIFMASILFFIPSEKEINGTTIIDSGIFAKLPWDIVLLFGGGFALAKGFQVSGLSTFIGSKLQGIAGVNIIIVIMVICFSMMLLTELTSNTATTQMILPIMASLAVAMKINPLLLMIPATLSPSCAFMLPVATPPNAIVFSSGRIRMFEMARVGILINLISVPLITAIFYFMGKVIFEIDIDVFPEWAVIAGEN